MENDASSSLPSLAKPSLHAVFGFDVLSGRVSHPAYTVPVATSCGANVRSETMLGENYAIKVPKWY